MNCTSCKKEIPAKSKFCCHCGEQQKLEDKKFKFDFKIRKFNAAEEKSLYGDFKLLDEVNQWLSEQSLLIYQMNCEQSKTLYDEPALDSISFIYMPFAENEEIYQIDCVIDFHPFSDFDEKRLDDILEEWQNENPNKSYLSKSVLEGETVCKIFILHILKTNQINY